jgi:predicted Kef-type K+ transport protein
LEFWGSGPESSARCGADPDLLLKLPVEVRRELLLVLTSESAVRADVIRQFHERREDSMVEVLTELEADEFLRGQVVEALRRVK